MPPKTEDKLLLEHGKYDYVTALSVLMKYHLNHGNPVSKEQLETLFDKNPLAFEIHKARVWKRRKEILNSNNKERLT